MAQRDREPNPEATIVPPTDPGAVLILNAEQDPGQRLARALSEAGLAVVLQSASRAAITGDLLQELVEAGGRAAAVECCTAEAPAAADILAGLAILVGPITALVLNPRQGHAHTSRAPLSPIGLDARAVSDAENACLWSRALVEALPHPSQATIVGLELGQPPSSVREAVPRALWQGLLHGLRQELGARGARVLSYTMAPSGAAPRLQREARAAARIVELLRRPPQAPRRASRQAVSAVPAPRRAPDAAQSSSASAAAPLGVSTAVAK